MHSRARTLATLAMLALTGLTIACNGYQPPTLPSSTATPAAIGVPARLVLTASTRALEQQLDVTAQVLDATGHGVPSMTVTFTISAGTVTPASATTDATGTAHAIAVATDKATLTATAGTITSSADLLASVSALSVSLFASSAQTGSATTLAASVSGPPIGAALTYRWSFGDAMPGLQGTASPITHTYAAAGTYRASVTVTDALGRAASSTATAIVSDPLPPPPPPAPAYAVSLAATPAVLLVGATSTLTATVLSQNGAPAPTSYAWDCTGAGAPIVITGLSTQPCTYATVGSIVSRVTVSSGSGASVVSGAASVTLTVTAAPLFVSIVPSTSTPAVGASVSFTATVTSGGNVPAVLQWQWDDTNDGTYDVIIPSAANGNVRATAYGAAGPVTIKVLVTDTATGRTATGTRTVTVQ